LIRKEAHLLHASAHSLSEWEGMTKMCFVAYMNGILCRIADHITRTVAFKE